MNVNFPTSELRVNVDGYSLEYWDEFIEMQKQIFGERWPEMTYCLFARMGFFDSILKKKNQAMTAALAKQWMDLVDEVEKELLITHGREHWDYKMMADSVHLVRVKIRSL